MSRIEWVIVGALALVWLPGLLALAEVWSTVEYASHGYLVPLVALWAATAHRETLATLPPEPPATGRLLLVLTAPLAIFATLLRDPTLTGVFFVGSVIAAVYALRGAAWLRTLQFPLVYLVFMIPLPTSWVTPLIVKLQILVSSVAVRGLQATGVAIFRDGNVLTLPGDQSLFVAEACSGITSLITLLPIGVFVAYFTESEAWRRWSIVAAVVPIALAGNLLRVVVTVWLAMEVDVEFATTGPLHEWAGIATYGIGCLCLLAFGGLLRRFVPEDEIPEPA